MNDKVTNADGLAHALAFAADARAAGQSPQEGLDGKKFVIVPPSYTVREFEPINKELGRIQQKPSVLDASSFIGYFNRFKNPNSQIFADYTSSDVVGILDYHVPPSTRDTSVASVGYAAMHALIGTPQYGDHRVAFRLPFSEPWARWRAIDGKPMSQKDFGEFIEENYVDISKPAHADMLSIVLNLEAKKDVQFASATTLQTGDVQLTYAEETKQVKGTMSVPKKFELTLPVYNGGKPAKMECLLRFNIDEGRLAFTIKMARRAFVEREAFEAIVKEIGEKTSSTPYMAKP